MNPDTHDSKHRSDMVLSYNRVRNALGILGVAMPIMLIMAGLFSQDGVQTSLSDYFHTTSRDIFVGCLFAMGVFLISYRGYQRADGEWISDDLIATIAGLSAFGIALFPNKGPVLAFETVAQEAVGFTISPIFHFGSALLFYLCMSLFCYIKFTKNASPARRRIYIACGHAIWASGLSIALFSYLKNSGSPAVQDYVVRHNIIFWVEAVGIWAFALSWLVKGKADMVILRLSQRRPQP